MGTWRRNMLITQGVATIFECFFAREFCESRAETTYVEWAVAGDRRKWLAGCRLRGWPEVIGRTEVQIALRLISAVRRVN